MMTAKQEHVARNVASLAGDSIAFSIGFAFYDPTVVIPTFVGALNGSAFLVGLIAAIRMIFITLPQIWAAGILVASPRKKPLLAWSSFWGRLPVLALAIATLLWARSAPWAVLLVLTVGVAIFYTSEGLNSVSWPDIVAKVIPVRIRGRFLGAGQLLSSAGALVASYLVRDVLEGWGIHFPGNWALMFALASVGLFLSVLLIFVIREEPDDKTPTRVDVRRNLADMFGFLRVDGRLRRVVGAQLALGVAAAAFPFLVIRAQELLTDGGALVSNFLVMRNLGGMVAALICGYLIDRVGSRAAIRVVGATQCLALAAVVVGPALHLTWIAYLVAFLLLGFVGATSWWSYSAYLMEIATPEERPVYLATSGIITSPAFIGAIVAGALFEVMNAELLFGIALAISLVGLWAIWTIRAHPRPQAAA
jgi:MFS family permease